MSKKKTPNRKHKFKYTEPVVAGAERTFVSASGTTGSNGAAHSIDAGAYAYVANDVKRILGLAAFLIILELLVWYGMSHFAFLKAF